MRKKAGIENAFVAMVIKELVVAMSGLVTQFETQFVAVATQFISEERLKEHNPVIGAVAPGGWNMVTGESAPL